MAKASRHFWLDNLRGFAIALIVLGHVEGVPAPWRHAIYAVHVPLFFVITGILTSLRPTDERPLAGQIAARALRLFWPYAAFSLIIMGYQLLCGRPGEALNIARYTLLLEGCNTLWFLPACFFAECLFLCVRRLRLPMLPAAAVLAALSAAASLFLYYVTGCVDPVPLGKKYMLITDAARMCCGASFMLFACALWPRIAQLTEMLRGRNAALPAVCALMAVGVCLLLSQANGMVDVHYGWQGRFPAVFWLAALLGTLGLAAFFSLLPECPPLAFFGRNTLTVMATHYALPVLATAQRLVKPLGGGVLSALAAFVLAMAMEIPIVLLVKNALPFLLGPVRRKTT